MDNIKQALNNIVNLIMSLAMTNKSFHLVLSYIKDDGSSDSIGITNSKDLADLKKMKADTRYDKYITDFLTSKEQPKFKSIEHKEDGKIIINLNERISPKS